MGEAESRIMETWSQENCEAVVSSLLTSLCPFDYPDGLLEHLYYQAELMISEANWHQLLRHNRKIHFVTTPPSPFYGWTLPPRIEAAGGANLLTDVIQRAERVYEKLHAFDPSLAAYSLTNAHRRQVVATCSLWELYHLINLRTAADAQWDIRQSMSQLHNILLKEQPLLARYIRRR
ncbi:FAD-dependent thymidylate synthase [Pasteuria penetrans]|uniref:FAD-dependent thymidylate synthase n=1 Tax=Pasteuria penetrans TaxID=86005 RepID=UPI001CAA4E72|nr:FAD-dependent thymidylate synthase [Pasteuria penetrans]